MSHLAALFCARLTGVAAIFLATSLSAFAADPSYRVLGQDRGKVSIVAPDGTIEWSYEVKAQAHDLHLLANGNVLLPIGAAEIAEVSPAKEIVWRYKSIPKPGYSGPIEVHAFQPLGDGRVMIAESGNARIIEVDRSGSIVHEVALTIEHPHPHRDTRMARKLDNGHYLVCHEADGKIREYDRDGKVVWTYALDLGGRPRAPGHGVEGHGVEVYGAIRLPSGNTLIGGGNNNRVLEVNPAGEVVWSVDQKELPGVTLAWVTTLHALPNGNVIIGNCHAGSGNPQLIEVRRDKKIVWKFNDFRTFGDSLASVQVLGVPAGTVR